MLPQIADFKAEADELNALLLTLDEADWGRVTQFKGWTVNDVIQHLHASDLLAAASADRGEPFDRMRAEIQQLRDSGMSRLQETQHRLGHLTGSRLREHWYAQVGELCGKLAALPPDARLKWVGPDMGIRMFTTARQMETWAHGQEIFDLKGVSRAPKDRIRNIAELGVRTYGWTFANRGMPAPGRASYVRLTSPSGAIWEWNDPASQDRVTGEALQFCQVVTQVRNVADTELQVTGEAAREWMRLAQCFAGPPEMPPPAGTRFARPRL